MAVQSFDVTSFQAQFPEFSASNPAALTAYWTIASETLDPSDSDMLSGATLVLALNLLTAHLAKSYLVINTGTAAPGVVQSASEGGVNVALVAPPAKTAWQWWLATTPYGVQLWALLRAQSAGGTAVGYSYERSAFRKTGGVF